MKGLFDFGFARLNAIAIFVALLFAVDRCIAIYRFLLVLGYIGDGWACTDIDECATNNGGCSTSPPVSCINVPGSSYCGPCPSGMLLISFPKREQTFAAEH